MLGGRKRGKMTVHENLSMKRSQNCRETACFGLSFSPKEMGTVTAASSSVPSQHSCWAAFLPRALTRPDGFS